MRVLAHGTVTVRSVSKFCVDCTSLCWFSSIPRPVRGRMTFFLNFPMLRCCDAEMLRCWDAGMLRFFQKIWKTVFGHEAARERTFSNENRYKRLRINMRNFFQKIVFGPKNQKQHDLQHNFFQVEFPSIFKSLFWVRFMSKSMIMLLSKKSCFQHVVWYILEYSRIFQNIPEYSRRF